MVRCYVCKNQKVQRFADKVSCIYYQCFVCQAIFVAPMPNKSSLQNYYVNHTTKTDDMTNKRLRSRAGHVLSICRCNNPNAEKLLDIGCGSGIFLDEVRIAKLNGIGIESSAMLSNFAKNHYAAVVYTDYFPSKRTHRFYGWADIVILSHVLEHVQNPRQFLEETLMCLSPHGMLVIETPNADSFLCLLERENYTFLTPPEHLCLYSLKSLIVVFNEIQQHVKIVKIETFSEPEHCMGILKILYRQCANRVGNNQSVKTKTYRNEPKLSFWKRLKFFLFDSCLVKLLVPFFNLNNKGSILRLYVQKT